MAPPQSPRSGRTRSEFIVSPCSVFDFLDLFDNIISMKPTDYPTSFNMNAAMNDSHKRTSISQLLNPLGAVSQQEPMSSPPRISAIPSSIPSAPSQNGQDMQQGGSPGSSFQLRSASWEQGRGGGDDQSPSMPTDGPEMPRSYHYTPFQEVFDADSRPSRPRDGPSNFTQANGSWPSGLEVSNMLYGPSVIAPMYSDERTGEFC